MRFTELASGASKAEVRALLRSGELEGKTTLELTPGGRYLTSLKLFEKYAYTKAIKPWQVLSSRYAQAASGDVFAFVNNASPKGIFNRIELPILKANKNLSDIVYSPVLQYSDVYKP